MNQKQSWEEEFDKKAELSFARGGFLVTDYPRENGINHWCLDPLSIKDFIKQAIQTREREISESYNSNLAVQYQAGRDDREREIINLIRNKSN